MNDDDLVQSLDANSAIHLLDEFIFRLNILEKEIKTLNVHADHHVIPLLKDTAAKLLKYKNSIKNRKSIGQTAERNEKKLNQMVNKSNINQLANLNSPLLENKMQEFDQYLGVP